MDLSIVGLMVLFDKILYHIFLTVILFVLIIDFFCFVFSESQRTLWRRTC